MSHYCTSEQILILVDANTISFRWKYYSFLSKDDRIMYCFVGSKHYFFAKQYWWKWIFVSILEANTTPKQLFSLKDIFLKLEIKLYGNNQNKAISLNHKEATLSEWSKISRWISIFDSLETKFTTTKHFLFMWKQYWDLWKHNLIYKEACVAFDSSCIFVSI
jgi:hypothetical protein